METNSIKNTTSHHQYRFPYLLLSLYIAFLLSTVCLANKITLVGSLHEPGGIFAFVFTFCICDIAGEVYGYAYPRLFIWLGILVELIFAITVTCVAHFPSPQYFTHADAYQIVFDPTLRYVFSGFIALLIGEFTNAYLLTKWKMLLGGRFFVFRSIISTAIGQACITIIVDVLNYSGKITPDNLIWLMVSGYLYKMLFAIILAFPAWIVVQYLKKVEQIDFYDINTNFNPFIITLNSNKNLNPIAETEPLQALR